MAHKLTFIDIHSNPLSRLILWVLRTFFKQGPNRMLLFLLMLLPTTTCFAIGSPQPSPSLSLSPPPSLPFSPSQSLPLAPTPTLPLPSRSLSLAPTPSALSQSKSTSRPWSSKQSPTLRAEITKPIQNKKLTVIELNDTYALPTHPEDRIKLENKNLLNLKDERTRLILQGKKVGVTLLRVGDHTHKIVVVNSSQYKNYLLLQSLLDQTPHLQLDFFDDAFQVQGRLEQASTWLTLRKHFLTQYKMKAEITQEQIKIIEFAINTELIKKKMFPITLTLGPSPMVRLPPQAIKNHLISDVLDHYGITIKEDKTQLYAEPLIRVQVLLVEIRKSFAQNMGIEWPYEMSAKLVPEGLLPSGNEASMMAHFIATKGHGRVLANPVLLAKSGSEAEFFAGGEFPIKTKTKQTQTVIWKKYGITLKIKPQADADGKLSLDLNSEISSIDAGEKIEGIPSLFTNTLSSHFDLHQSQTIALSGLVKKIDGEAIKQWPGWGDLPILGSLFSSREYQEDKTELAVFVTPIIVNSQL